MARSLAEARDQANAASKAKSQFLTGITHELRTPLHGILGDTELLKLEGGLSATQTKRVIAMMETGDHLLAMINTVLDMSQIEANRLELHPDEIDLSAFMRACRDIVLAQCRGEGA